MLVNGYTATEMGVFENGDTSKIVIPNAIFSVLIHDHPLDLGTRNFDKPFLEPWKNISYPISYISCY